MINKIEMFGVQNIGPMARVEISALRAERRDLIQLSQIAHEAKDAEWMNEIFGRLGEIDFELYWNGEDLD